MTVDLENKWPAAPGRFSSRRYTAAAARRTTDREPIGTTNTWSSTTTRTSRPRSGTSVSAWPDPTRTNASINNNYVDGKTLLRRCRIHPTICACTAEPGSRTLRVGFNRAVRSHRPPRDLPELRRPQPRPITAPTIPRSSPAPSTTPHPQSRFRGKLPQRPSSSEREMPGP